MLKCDQPRGRTVVENPPDGPQTKSTPEGERKAMTRIITTMMIMMIMNMIMIMIIILIMTMVIVKFFLQPKGP